MIKPHIYIYPSVAWAKLHFISLLENENSNNISTVDRINLRVTLNDGRAFWCISKQDIPEKLLGINISGHTFMFNPTSEMERFMRSRTR